MLKERKLLEKSIVFVNEKNEVVYEGGDDVVGWYVYPAYMDDLYVAIKDDRSKVNISEEDFYLTEFESVESESDYHTFSYDYHFKGVYMAFNLRDLDIKKYFSEDLSDELFDDAELVEGICEILRTRGLIRKDDFSQVSVEKKGYLKVVLLNERIDDRIVDCSEEIREYISNYYDKNEVYILELFGSYVLLKKFDGELKAIKATSISDEPCPLMVSLLEDVDSLFDDKDNQEDVICKFINELIIKGDTNRGLDLGEADASNLNISLIDGCDVILNRLSGEKTNSETSIKMLCKKNLRKCDNCPYPHS